MYLPSVIRVSSHDRIAIEPEQCGCSRTGKVNRKPQSAVLIPEETVKNQSAICVGTRDFILSVDAISIAVVGSGNNNHGRMSTNIDERLIGLRVAPKGADKVARIVYSNDAGRD